ncbi:hypothetical protein KC332_g11061 [Hortaea werneckii]|nr:hypothetical protein KC350_g14768 [Hortaea werneckii]KAI6814595.1 hypothetical protein KC358_g11121 [Hortaea werneckii]KAI6905822.1 hypothetical protein KC348_g14876 [Hortaea werneckii]KAI6923598.1 hypothetical protein KC341_g14620 [Hortaea werneckii]KAI6963980.1 hypothetical protein KC321_g10933 [Hortaea werneckii]
MIKTDPDTDTAFPPPEPGSSHSSPSRRQASHLLADYRPTTPNGQHSTRGFALPQSPSLPEMYAMRSSGHGRTNSDVQGLVKRFEHLDVRDKEAESKERMKRHEAELKRAMIAREEAESDVRRFREEVRRLRKERDEGGDRERRVARRLETVMDELAHAKETHASQHAIYEKELRKARKEAFKSSSAVLKLQEELKSTRNSLRATQSGFDMEKQKVERRQQETFEAQYQLASVQEELDKLRTHLRIVEEEREALKTNLKEEEVARIAAEGMIALPPAKGGDDDDLLTSPKKSPQKRPSSPLSDDKENMGTNPQKKMLMQKKKLEEELRAEQMRREHAEEMMDFLRLECQFQCCSCRSAAEQGHQDGLEMSEGLAATLAALMQDMMSVLRSPDATDAAKQEPAEHMEVDSGAAAHDASSRHDEVPEVELEQDAEVPHVVEEVERSMTLAPEEAPAPDPVNDENPIAPHPTPAEPEQKEEAPSEQEEVEEAPKEVPHTTSVPIQPSSPQTPEQRIPTTPHQHHHTVRTITTTTTIPMHFTPVSKPRPSDDDDNNEAENVPPRPTSSHSEVAVDDSAPLGYPLTQTKSAPGKELPFDRAAALAAIEYRRGRARSFAAGHATPRKQMLEGVSINGRRDVSAPALGGKTVGGGGSSSGAVGLGRGPASVGRAGGRAGRVG